jgi:hypothetical protein
MQGRIPSSLPVAKLWIASWTRRSISPSVRIYALVLPTEMFIVVIDYVDVNPTAEKSIIMVHGWPSLWSSWGYQIEEFKVYISSIS